MIVDAHYHLEERMESLPRLLDQMDHFGIDRVALIAALVDPFAVEGLAEHLAAVARKALLGPAQWFGKLLYRSTVTSSGQFAVLWRRYAIYHEPDNEPVAAALEAYPDRFYGWVCVNPATADPIAELERWAGRPGWIGAKTHPHWHGYAVRVLDDVAAWCVEHEWPLLIHLGGDRARGDFRFLPERHPDLRVVYAHAAVPFYREAWEYAAGRDRVYVDLSSPYLDEPLRRAAYDALGAGHCVYGSDGPFGYPAKDGGYDHGHILGQLQRWGLSPVDTERLLSGTFRELANL
jgi:hypothetical protein